jgi:hypothetical protein
MGASYFWAMRIGLLLLFVVPLIGSAQSTRVLFIGNSYTYSNDLPGMFTQLAASLGEEVETGMVAPGGFTFEGHVTNSATQNAIAQGDWDFVVLQEQSQRPAFPPEQVAEDVAPYAALLVEQVRAANPCTEAVFLMTWGRENGDAQNCPSYPPLCTYEGMQQRLRESYLDLAYTNQAWCAPVGAVWAAFRADQPTTALYTDGSHPNVTGSYMAASTLFNTIFRHSSEEASFVPAGLSLEQQQFISQLSSTMVLDSTATWNIGVNDPVASADQNVVSGTTVLFANNTSGAIQQEWSFGDGSTSVDADPLHTYASSGIYTVTLTAMDVCGRSDTDTIVVNLTGTRTPELLDPGKPILSLRDGGLLVRNRPAAGILEVMDSAGRRWFHERLAAGDERWIPLPDGTTSALIWSLRSDDGQQIGGTMIAP